MRFTIVAVGKLKEAYLREGTAEFVKRLGRYGGVKIVELPEAKLGEKASPADKEKAVEDEGRRALAAVPKGADLVVLDVHGEMMSSESFAADIAAREVRGVSDTVFVIGGAFGVSEELRKASSRRLSLGPMTFTHQMARLLLVEQLYRACKINTNEPYHW